MVIIHANNTSSSYIVRRSRFNQSFKLTTSASIKSTTTTTTTLNYQMLFSHRYQLPNRYICLIFNVKMIVLNSIIIVLIRRMRGMGKNSWVGGWRNEMWGGNWLGRRGKEVLESKGSNYLKEVT